MIDKYKISTEDFKIMEEVVHLQQPFKAGKPWEFAGAFYYATTVLTTIGMPSAQSTWTSRPVIKFYFRLRPLYSEDILGQVVHDGICHHRYSPWSCHVQLDRGEAQCPLFHRHHQTEEVCQRQTARDHRGWSHFSRSHPLHHCYPVRGSSVLSLRR